MWAPRPRVAAVIALATTLSAAPGARASDAPAESLARLAPWARDLFDERGRMPVLAEVPRGGGRALGLRELVPGLGAGKLAPSAISQLAAGGGVRPVAGPPKRTHLDSATGSTFLRATDLRAETGLTGRGVVVGVVDTGIDVAHPTFRAPDTGATRIAWLLTGGEPRGVHAEVEERMGCNDAALGPCAVWSAEDLDAALASGEELPSELRDGTGHGTHVAGIAAGNGRWPAGREPAEEDARFVGVAPAATLIIAATGSGGSFSDPDILQGATFVFDRADALGQPAVLNLSLGGDFGPHDGTSLLEKGLASLVGDDRPGRAIVVSSGNSGELFEVRGEAAGIHTEARARPHARARVPVLAAGEGSLFFWITMRKGDRVSVGVEGRDGETWIDPVVPGDEVGYEDGDDAAGVVNALVGDSSDLTEDTNGAVVVVSSAFADEGEEVAILLEGEGDAQLWITPSAQVTAFFRRGVVEGTVAVPATHPRLLAVGASVARTRWKSIGGDTLTAGAVEDDDRDGVAAFSACGPTATGLPKPELVAPGQFIVSAMSADADPRASDAGIFAGACPAHAADCLVVDEGYAVSAGTSMASPAAAGVIALLLDRDPNLTQARVHDLLRAGARRFRGPVPLGAQAGPGALDAMGALAAMAGEEPGAGAPPELGESWWTLFASYARPDPTWPVHGVVQLRRADGSLASGLDGSLLSLEVDGGSVLSHPTRVRHGTFSFAVGGRRGTAGSSMRVRVSYDGIQLGDEVVLPIGGDVFDATTPPEALGGCACRAAPGAPGPSGPLVVALALLSGLGLRRRR